MRFIEYLIESSQLDERENQGQQFERETYETLEKWLTGVATSDKDVDQLFAALRRVDRSFTADRVVDIHRGGGSPRRPRDIADSGGVIADLVFVMSDGSKKYVSIKHSSGSTFANFGEVSDFINRTTIEVNKDSRAARVLSDAGVDLATVQQGFQDRANDVQSTYPTRRLVSVPIVPGTDLYDTLKHAWGSNYIYLRQNKADPTGWFSMNLNDATHKKLFDGLHVYKISYPHNNGNGSKQTTVFFKNGIFSYELELRNKSTFEFPNRLSVRIR